MDCWKICENIKKTLPQNVRLPSCELYNTCNLYAWLRKSTYSVGNCIQYVLQVAYNCIQYVLRVAYNCIQYVLQVTYNFIKHTLRVIRLILILTLIYIVWSGFSALFLIYTIACNETTVVGNWTPTSIDKCITLLFYTENYTTIAVESVTRYQNQTSLGRYTVVFSLTLTCIVNGNFDLQ